MAIHLEPLCVRQCLQRSLIGTRTLTHFCDRIAECERRSMPTHCRARADKHKCITARDKQEPVIQQADDRQQVRQQVVAKGNKQIKHWKIKDQAASPANAAIPEQPPSQAKMVDHLV